jgi:tetratricopeptide (TPR) repeat protein
MIEPPPIAPPAPSRSWLPRQFLRLVRFVLHRPGRAALYFALAVALLAALLFAIQEGVFRWHRRDARREVERGHNAAAGPHLAACLSIHPRDPETLMLCAVQARRSGNWEDAEALLTRYSRERGDDADLVFERLLLRATRGDLENSAPLLIARIEAGGPDARPAREALVTGLLYRFRWTEADRTLAGWLRASPDDPFALLLRGKFLEQRQQASEALINYRRIVELDPEHDEARLRMTTLLLQLRQGEEALTHLDYLRVRLPNLPEVQVQRAKALALQGRTEEARAALDDCVSRIPDHAGALAERAALAVQAGDDRAAERDYARAVELSPGDVTILTPYAAVLARTGKTAEAAKLQETLKQLQADQERISELIAGPLQTRPDDPSIPHEIAAIALRSGQSAEGFRWLNAALQIDPNHAPTHRLLANYYQTAGNPALAARHRALARSAEKKP